MQAVCTVYACCFSFMQNSRQQAILDLIGSTAIGRQDELARLLSERGFSVTQASVSRDLEKLGVAKVHGRYVRQPTARFGAFGLVSFTPVGDNLIVIKCSSGLASAAAVRIDAAGIPEIAGTIAGDDTIFIAVNNSEAQRRAIRELRNILETGDGNGNN
jgi:transcriptional regulator of arginine metabolism